MANREKVFEGLERCSKHDGSECPKCPYFNSECTDDLMADALALLKEQQEQIDDLKQTAQSMMEGICLLKEQEAVVREWIYKHDNLWYCSRCGEIIYSETDEDLAVHHAYCSQCGAKMKQEGL